MMHDARRGSALSRVEDPSPPGRRWGRLTVPVRALLGTAGTNAWSAGLVSLASILVARDLGPRGRGLLAVVLVWPNIVMTIVAFGLPQATCYWVSRDPTRATGTLAVATRLSAALGVVVGAIGFLVAPAIGNGAATSGLRWMFAGFPLFLVMGVWLAALQAFHIGLWNVTRCIQTFIYVTAVIGFALANVITVERAAIAYVAGIALETLVAGVLLRRRIGLSWRDRGDIDAGPLIRYGSRAFLSTAPMQINSRLDQMVLSFTVSPGALGNYAAAVSLGLVAWPIATAFGHMALPRIAAARTTTEARKIERIAIAGSLLTATLALLPFALAAHWIIPLIFGPGFSGAVTPFLILVPGTILFLTNQVAGDVLRGWGRPLAAAIAEWLGAIVTVGLLLLLAPRYGITGAAVASSLAYATVALFLWRALRRTDSTEMLRFRADAEA